VTAKDEWSQWGELWQQQPSVDIRWWQKRAARKRLRMQGIVAIELLLSLSAVGQCLRLFGDYGMRWRIWGGLTLLFVLILQGFYLHIRRGTWRASGADVRSLLQLTAARAHAGIRLAKLNIWGTLLWVVFTLLVAMPELDPGRWQTEPKLERILLLQFAVNTPMIVILLIFCAWYIRRQRQRLRSIHALLGIVEDDA
jgi:hypothetical protein